MNPKIDDLVRRDRRIRDAKPVEEQLSAILLHSNEDLLHGLVRQIEWLVSREEAAELLQFGMLVRPEDASGVEDYVPENAKVADSIAADLLHGNSLRLRKSGTDLILPVREQKDDDRPRMLLLVRPALGVRGEIILSPDDSGMDHVWLCWIFVAGPDDHLAPGIIDRGPAGTVHSMNLALDARVVSREAREGVDVCAHLLVHKVNARTTLSKRSGTPDSMA